MISKEVLLFHKISNEVRRYQKRCGVLKSNPTTVHMYLVLDLLVLRLGKVNDGLDGTLAGERICRLVQGF